MANIRVPDTLLARLKEAAPPGVPLANVIAEALALGGGPSNVRRSLETVRDRKNAVASGRRRVALGFKDACMDPDDQVSLAEATRTWLQVLERNGTVKVDLKSRSIVLRARPSTKRDRASRGIHVRRRGNLL